MRPAEIPSGRPIRGGTTQRRAGFAVTLHDGRRVVGQHHGGQWAIYVYSNGGEDRLIGHGSHRTRPRALEHAGLSGDDAGEVLGRAGI